MIVVRTLGAAEIAVGDHLLKPTSTKKFALLLYLTAERGRHTTRAVLQDLLFPDLPEKNARHALRELVYQLRQLGAPIIADNDGVGLPSEAVRSDYSEVMEAERLSDDQVQAVEGGLLPGYAPGHSESYSEWLDNLRADVVSGLCRRVFLDLATADKSSSRSERLARACIALDPLNEQATRALVESLLVSGSRAQANAILANYRDEVGRALFVRSALPEVWPGVADVPVSASRFLGRENELQVMLSRLDLVWHGSARTVVVAGTAGIGKSRLLREFSDLARLRGAIVVQARSLPSDVGRPMSALTDILPQLLEAPGALGCSPDRLRHLRLLTAGHRDGSGDSSLLGDRDFTFAGIRELLESITEESPLLVILDDAHWMDDVSLRFLDDIVNANTSRLLIVCATRSPERAAGIGSEDRVSVVHLAALSDHAARAVIRSELPDTDDGTQRWLCDACAGNPLYLELLMAQARTNSKERGLPPAMIDAIDGNIRNLSKDARAVLLYTALLERHVTVDRLLRLTSRGPIELTIVLEELVGSGLLPDLETETPQPHRLVADRIRRAASKPARLAATRCVAELLTEDAGEAGAALAWDAAQLWLEVGEKERPSRLIESCATHALQLGRAREAAILLRDAGRIGGARQKNRLLVRATSIAAQSNELDLVLELSSELREADDTPFPPELIIAELHARLCWGHDQSALGELRQLVSFAPSTDQRRQAAFELLRVADAQRDPTLSEAAFAELGPWLESPDCDRESRLRILISYHASFGDEQVARELASEALEVSESMPPFRAAQMKRLAGIALFRAGAVEEAITAWLAAFRSAEISRSTRSQFETAVMIAATSLDTGDVARADHWEQVAGELIAQLPDLGNTLLWLVHRSDGAVCRDDIETLLDCRRRFIDRVSHPVSRRACRWLAALDAHIELLRKSSRPDRRTIGALLNEQHAGEETGEPSDFETSAVLRMHLHRGEISEARLALDRYLKEVRVRHAPLWSSLRQVADRLEALELTVQSSTRRGPFLAQRQSNV